MTLYDPPHPGETIRKDCLKPLNLSVEEAAEGLGVRLELLTDIVNGQTSVFADMAIRLAKGFGGSPKS